MMASTLTCKLLDVEDQDDDLATLSTRRSDDEASSDDGSVLDEEILEDCLQKARSGSSVIGFVIGLFIQASTLGLNFLLASITEEEDDPTIQTYVNMTIAWSIFSASLAVGILFLMRSLMVSAFYSTNDPDSCGIEQKEQFMAQLISTIEKLYAVGALGGVGIAWCVTDIILDVKSHLFHSLITFFVATLWYTCS